MSKKPAAHRKTGTPQAAPPTPEEWSGWKWIVLCLLAAGVVGGATVLINRSGWFAKSESPPPEPEAPFDALAQPTPPAMVMVHIPGGTFKMGTTDKSPHFADAPEHEV